MRRLLSVLSVVLFTFLPAQALAPSPYPAPTGYINDFAGVLSSSTRTALELQATELHQKTQTQILVVTVKSLDGNDIKPFANDLFHSWKIGDKATDRGVLILFAIADHKYRIEVGYGLEGILNDAKAGDIGRSLVPSLRAGNYDAAVQQAFSGVAGILAADKNVTLTLAPADPSADPVAQALADTTPTQTEPDAADSQTPANATHLGRDLFRIGLFLLGALGFFGFVAYLLSKARPSGVGTGSRSGGSDSSSSFFTSSDSDSSSSSSSSSSSDSGSDFDGGGGGDSGGGGADGSW